MTQEDLKTGKELYLVSRTTGDIKTCVVTSMVCRPYGYNSEHAYIQTNIKEKVKNKLTKLHYLTFYFQNGVQIHGYQHPNIHATLKDAQKYQKTLVEQITKSCNDRISKKTREIRQLKERLLKLKTIQNASVWTPTVKEVVEEKKS